MYDELIYPGQGINQGDEYYIAKVHPEDAYYKYQLVGCKFLLRSCTAYKYPLEASTIGEEHMLYLDKFEGRVNVPYVPFYYFATGRLLDGPLLGLDISFWKVMLSRDFPFYSSMREAVKED